MTVEEAIKVIKDFSPNITMCWDEIMGMRKALDLAIQALQEKQDRESEPKALTWEELEFRKTPVYVPLENEQGYWCLCNNGLITPPSLISFKANKRDNWTFYDRPPLAESDKMNGGEME